MTGGEASPPVLPVIIGTAGHVDHGKTSLVRRLTGFETDRLVEEQRRGVSIESRMAPFEMPGVGLVGLVDVPGHEDFVRNMVAGASNIDVLLLVVAADDAVMPQTVEHMRIVKLLGMAHVLAVITKTDLVDEDLAALVQSDVEEFMAASGFSAAPVFRVSNQSGEGIAAVRDELARIVAGFSRSEDRRAFRMYVRNSFTMKGHGTVATGVPISGRLALGDEVEILPGGKKSTVRALQNYRRQSQETAAHISSALNLREVSPDEVEQGTCIAAPGIYSAVRTAVVSLHNESSAIALKRRATLRFLVGTAARVARVRLLDTVEAGPGAQALAELRFSEPVPLAAGDRFILRNLSPADTVGGGRVLSAFPARVTKITPLLLARFARARECLEAGDLAGAELFAGGEPFVEASRLPKICQRQDPREETARLLKDGILLGLVSGKAAAEYYFVQDRREEVVVQLARRLSRYHRLNPYTWGMKPEHAAGLLGISPAAFAVLSNRLTGETDLVLRHGTLGLRAFSPQISAKEIRLREQMLAEIEKAGLATIAKGPLKESLGMSQSELNLLVRLLVEEQLIAVAGNNLLPARALEHCKQVLLELAKEFGVIELKAFRERTGTSRNIAVALLEQFDSEGLTKRQGEVRVLASGSLVVRLTT